MNNKNLPLLLLSIAAPLAFAALPRPTAAAFDKGATITVSGYTGSAPLSGFPVLVRIAAGSPAGFAYSDLHSSSDGADLAFIDMDGNGLPFEIDTWDPNGTSLVWVKLPTMGQGTQFVMCWGSASSGKTVCADSPFADYVGVWHMSEASGTVADSSGHSLDAEPTGAGAATLSVAVSGPVGNGRQCSNSTSVRSYLKVPSYDSRNVGNTFAVSGWFNVGSGQSEKDARLFARKTYYTEANGWEVVWKKNGEFSTRGASSTADAKFTPNPSFGAGWKHFFMVYDNRTSTIYENGVQKAQKTDGTAATDNNVDLGIGDYPGASNLAPLVGSVDECRLLDAVPSADWAKAEYDSMANASFLTVGAAEAYGANPDPMGAAVVSNVGYTNASLAVTVTSVGDGASRADVTVAVSATADFASPLWTTSYSVTGSDSRSFGLAPLSTGTTYRVRATIANNLGNSLVLEPDPFATLAPGAPEASAASFLSRGFATLSAQGAVTDFGTGSASATMRLEASSDGFATVAAASAESVAALGETAAFTVENLTPGTDYSLRIRIVNEWGLEAFVPVSGTYATRAVPFAVTGIGWTFSPDGSAVDFSFGVSGVFAGATGTAELEYDGRTVSSQPLSAAGTLVWQNVAAAAGTATATVTVSAEVGGTTYTQSWTATVAPGTAAYVVSTLSELSNIAFRVGDSATLPEPAVAGDYYLPLDVRVFSIGADGVTLAAVEPGFSAVCAMEWNGDAGAYVRNAAMGLAVCLPKAEGRVFLAQAGGANMNWSETAKWRCLSDPTVTGEYPDGSGDVAMVPLARDKTITLDVDATVGAVYVGWDASAPAAGKTYFRAANHALTFDTGAVGADESKIPGLFRITGLTRADVNGDRPEFTFGGNAAGSRLAVVVPDGLVLDGGKCTDYADTTLRNNHNRLRFWTGHGDMAVPAGKTLRLDHFDHSGWSDSQMGNCSGFVWSSGFPIAGAGTIVYDSAAFGYFDGALKDFAGTLVIHQRQRFHAKGVDSRGGGFWLKAGVGYEAKDATFVIDGESDYANAAQHALGLAAYGSTHGSGAWGPGDNCFGGRAMVMAGGVLVHRGNNNANWAKNGIYAIPNRSDALVVSNGYSVIDAYNYQAATVAVPTNRMEFASLRHANRGTLRVSTTDTANYSQSARTSSSHCIVRNAAGFAIGGGGADGSYKESVIPWIVSEQQWNNRLYFPYLGTRDGETDCLVLYKHPTAKSSLAAATDPDENVFVHEKTIALSADVTVNALYLNKNWSKGTALGAGRTLTVTSGGVILEGERCAIGQESDFTAGTAGTLFLPNEGYLYSTAQSATEPNEMWAAIVAPKGLAVSFPGFLRLGGDQTGIDEELAINGCDVTLGSETTGCTIDVPVRLESGAAKLRIGKQGSFCCQDLHLNDHAGIGPKFEPAAGTVEPVHMIRVDGVPLRRGTWGSSESPAEFIDDNHFAGTGVADVRIDGAPSTAIFLY